MATELFGTLLQSISGLGPQTLIALETYADAEGQTPEDDSKLKNHLITLLGSLAPGLDDAAKASRKATLYDLAKDLVEDPDDSAAVKKQGRLLVRAANAFFMTGRHSFVFQRKSPDEIIESLYREVYPD